MILDGTRRSASSTNKKRWDEGRGVYVHAEGAGDAVVGGADGCLDVDPESIARVLGGAGGGVGVPLREQRRLGGGGRRRRGGGPGAGGEPLHLGPTPPESRGEERRGREAHGRKEMRARYYKAFFFT